MAQLNDLLVLGNTSLIGDVNASGEIVASKLAGDGSSITNINAANISGTLSVAQGGTGKSTWTAYGLIYASAATTLAQISTGTSGYVLQSGGSSKAPSWIQATNANTASTIIKRDANGNFSAGTITANLSGNASSATKLATARTLSISDTAGGTAPTFNGTANATLSIPKNVNGFNRVSFTTTDNGISPTA
jgi:hypothetical protein